MPAQSGNSSVYQVVGEFIDHRNSLLLVCILEKYQYKQTIDISSIVLVFL